MISNDEKRFKTLIEDSIVEDLCDKQIIEFKAGINHIFARTTDGELYSWGSTGERL